MKNTCRVIKDYRLSSGQRQAQDADTQPADVKNSKSRVQSDGVVAEENSVVEHEDDAGDLTAEVCRVADHEKSIRLLDWVANGLVTTTKLGEVCTELSLITDGFDELIIQLVELIVQETCDNVVHCLSKLARKNDKNKQWRKRN